MSSGKCILAHAEANIRTQTGDAPDGEATNLPSKEKSTRRRGTKQLVAVMASVSGMAAVGLTNCATHNALNRRAHRELRAAAAAHALHTELKPQSLRGVASPWQLPLQLLRRRPTALKAQVEEEESTVAPENGVATRVENDVSAPIESQSSWLPALPHALTAAMANFMFGYHIGVMNGPLESIARELKFEGDTIMEGFVVSIFIVGAFLGSVGGGVFADKLGRKRTFQLDAIPLVLGAALSATAQSANVMILGRFLVGIGIGVNTGLVPMYISEVAPTKFRGALGSLCQVGTCVGIISALLIGLPAETDPHWWRTMLWLATIPGVALIVGMQFTAESPRWLGKMGRWDEAESIIESLWGKPEVGAAMEELRAANSSEGQEEDITWSELVQAPYFKVAFIGSALFALQQFAGINGVLYFSSLTFKDAGITNGIAASAAVGVANLVGAVVALSLMDNQGRRKLLMGSYGGMAISMALLVAALGMPDNPDVAHTLSVGGTLLYVFTFALGAGPVTALIIPELCTTRLRSKTMAVSLCTHWVCNFGIGLFFLELVQRLGLQAVYTSFGVVALLAIAFANSYIIETKGRSLEEIETLMNSK